MMKKVYLLALTSLIAGSVSAQVSGKSAVVEPATVIPQNTDRPVMVGQDRAPDDIIWQDQFDNPADWDGTAPVGGLDSLVNGWSIGSTTLGWAFGSSGDMGTSGGFARFVNDDPTANPTTHVENGPFTLEYVGTPIDLTGVPAPHIEFEQYGARFLTLQAVEVSTDGGTTWVEVGNNNDIEPLTQGGGSAYGKPETRRFNITSAVQSAPSNVTVRLLWDGAMNGPNMNYVEYGWFVDNIRIVEGHSYDSDIQQAFFVSGAEQVEYYMVPETQITAIDFSAITINNGGLTFNGLHLVATVENGGTNVYTGTSNSVNLAPVATDSFAATTQFTPANGQGLYSFKWDFEGDFVDTYPINDSLTDTIEVTQYTYARDKGISTGSIGNVTSNNNGAMAIGNTMEIFADGVIGAIDVYIDDATAGDLVYGRIDLYDDNSGDFLYVDQTSDYSLTSGDIGGWVRLTFDSPVQVNAGDILLITAGHYGGDPSVRFGYAQPTYDFTVLGYDATSSLFSLTDPNAIMVRADMRDFTSVEDQTQTGFSIGQNVPNPFGNNSTITYTLEENANVSVEFIDISGKVVTTVNQGNQDAGTYQLKVDANDFAEGVYFYTFTVGDKKVTKRMVVTK